MAMTDEAAKKIKELKIGTKKSLIRNKAEGDKLAAFNLAEAARTMAASPGAMQLRTLQTIDGLGPSPSNTVVLAFPVLISTYLSPSTPRDLIVALAGNVARAEFDG